MNLIATLALAVSWGPYAIFSTALAIAIGVWCLLLYQRAGKKGWQGFLLGFALTFVFFIVGAGVAVLVAYRQTATKPGGRQVDVLR